jgi:KDO2-lipid IV(A) lauroyltransferase
MWLKVFVYPLLKGISLLPFPLLYGLSNLLYFFLYQVFGYRKAVVRRNLKNAFPDKDSAWLMTIEKDFYRHLTDLILETFKGMSLSESELKKRLINVSQELYDEANNQNRSSIIIMSHAGNWEWVCMSAQLHAKQKAQCIYKQLKNPFFEKLMLGIRSKFGTMPIPMEQTLRVMATQKDIITATAFMGDQNPSSGKNVYWTRFLNQDTAFMWGTEKIARKFNHEVWYMQVKKVRRGYYEAHTRLLCANPAATQEGEITEMLATATEEDILSQPAMWLWSHRRWKHKKG